MDLVTENLLNTFKTEQGFPDDIDQPTLFEHFANYCMVSNERTEDFEIEEIHVAGGNDLGLDGLAVLVNGVFVTTIEEVDDLVNTNKYIDAEFIFVQAKSGKSFEGTEISNMFYGIRDLFATSPTLPRNENLARKELILRHIYSKSALFRHGNPQTKLYFVTTGKWENDPKLNTRIETERGTLEDLSIFEEVTFEPVDAKRLQHYYNRSQNALTKTFEFANKVTLPTMEGVREAYLGYVRVSEYLSMITDDSGNLLRGLFYDNVRDFQGDNPVNVEIAQTLKTAMKGAFVLLNNGVTVVSEDLKATANSFTLRGFQIVNGCQTSHVLFNNQDKLDADVHIPIKLVVAPEGALKNQVIKATNRQTVVKTEELSALTDFQKHLEEFYAAIPEAHRLYYERRSQQYSATGGLEKVRIITIPTQIRAFASMFLNRAHQASRYYGTLLKDGQANIFVDGHFPLPYYLSAYALYRIESLLRRRQIDSKYRPFKYHLLGFIRMEVAGVSMPSMNANQFEKFCEPLKVVLWDETKYPDAVTRACKLLDTILAGDYNRDLAKDSSIQSRARAILTPPPSAPASLSPS